MRVSVAMLALALACGPSSVSALTCGTSDDTAEVQAAIDGAAITFDAVAPLHAVRFPNTPCRVSSLNMTARAGVALIGPGTIIPIRSDTVVLDLSGSANIVIRDIRIAGVNNLSVKPTVGILMSQIEGPLFGWSNRIVLDNVQVDGRFSLGSLFILGVPSSSIASSQFSQYAGHPEIAPQDGSAPNAWITGHWWGGNVSPYQTMKSDAHTVPTDWTFSQVEFHNYGAQAGLWIGGAQDLRFIGGNVSSQQFIAVDVNTTSVGGVTSVPARLLFMGTTFYADFGAHGPCAVRNQALKDSLHFTMNFSSFPVLVC